MQRYFCFVVLVCLAIDGLTQPSLTSEHLPQPGESVITRDATLLTDVDLSFTGPNQSWVFDSEVIQSGNNVTTVNCLAVESTPLTYQFLFNNPFDPEHNSDFAQGVDNVNAGQITLEDAYAYFQNNSNRYAQVGLGATINGIPVPAQGNPVDVIYEFPIEYGDQYSGISAIQFNLPTLGFWRSDQTRSTIVDGWGSIQIYGLTFPVVRCVSTIDAIDSIYIDFLQTGTLFPRPQVVEYKWMNPAFNTPVLQITTTGGIVTSVTTPDFFASVTESSFGDWNIFPNPAADRLYVQGFASTGELFTIYDLCGKTALQGALIQPWIDLQSLPAGAYVVRIGENQARYFVKE